MTADSLHAAQPAGVDLRERLQRVVRLWREISSDSLPRPPQAAAEAQIAALEFELVRRLVAHGKASDCADARFLLSELVEGRSGGELLEERVRAAEAELAALDPSV